MQQSPVYEKHYDKEVWVNPTTEAMRRTECLCLNCGHMKPGEEDHCRIAAQLYKICVSENVAMTITRCPVWMPKE